MPRCALAVAVMLCTLWWGQEAALAGSQSARSPWAPVSVLLAKGARILGSGRTTAGKAQSRREAQAPDVVPPLPVRKDQARKRSDAEEPAPDGWQPAEIAAAQVRCDALLKGLDAVVVPHPPIKEGKCGAAAPIRLVGFGKSPQVSFSPPALVNCKMAAALHKWINTDLQPLAVKHLGARITTVEVMSDYSCRTAMGRVGNRLSEHAFADALDIRGFVTETGQKVRVLDGWGLTDRDIAAQLAAAQAKAKARKDEAASGARSTARTALQVAASRLGGPGENPHEKKVRPQDDAAKVAALSPQVLEPPAAAPKSQFLRAAHATACRLFGTTLGPEANDAHRNHFHVDMAKRRYKRICD